MHLPIPDIKSEFVLSSFSGVWLLLLPLRVFHGFIHLFPVFKLRIQHLHFPLMFTQDVAFLDVLGLHLSFLLFLLHVQTMCLSR